MPGTRHEFGELREAREAWVAAEDARREFAESYLGLEVDYPHGSGRPFDAAASAEWQRLIAESDAAYDAFVAAQRRAARPGAPLI